MIRARCLFVLLLALLFSPACNYPGLKIVPTGLPADALRQTLDAQLSTTTPSTHHAPGGTRTPSTMLFLGLATATPGNYFPAKLTESIDSTTIKYFARVGDTLTALSGRFGGDPGQITSVEPIPAEAFIPIGQLLNIPNVVGASHYPSAVLPDSEVINSPSTVGFDVQEYINKASGYLNIYGEMVTGQRVSGADIIQRVALESSVNPRFLLALLEYRSGWVLGQPMNSRETNYPIGFHVSGWNGLYKELVISATHLNAGYYGWRTGTITEMVFQDGSNARVSPSLNPGSVAVQTLFSKLYTQDNWRQALYGSNSFLQLYHQMFGDPWARAGAIEPIFPYGLAQPELELPFAPGERWSLTGGPHPSWNTGSPRGALDLAPVTGESQCAVSRAWVTASANGLVVRSARNVVVIDLDGDGYEQTGWILLYLHIAEVGSIPVGTWVEVDYPIGHPSCEGGTTTGTHVHMARKYNGEWIAADGPLPFVLSGWEAYEGEKNYQGGLKKGDQVAVASPVGPRTSIVIR